MAHIVVGAYGLALDTPSAPELKNKQITVVEVQGDCFIVTEKDDARKRHVLRKAQDQWMAHYVPRPLSHTSPMNHAMQVSIKYDDVPPPQTNEGDKDAKKQKKQKKAESEKKKAITDNKIKPGDMDRAKRAASDTKVENKVADDHDDQKTVQTNQDSLDECKLKSAFWTALMCTKGAGMLIKDLKCVISESQYSTAVQPQTNRKLWKLSMTLPLLSMVLMAKFSN